ncbi:MAG: PD-(D/E)XK nuclease family protein, partial [Comamonadaceae bacterium]
MTIPEEPRATRPPEGSPTLAIDDRLPGGASFDAVVRRAAEWIAERSVHPARTVVLVPYAQLMQTARRSWIAQAAEVGFVPRFETTRNWARARQPFALSGDDLAFDMARDLLTAQSLLARAGLAAQQVALAGRLVEMALQLAPLASAVEPAARGAWAARAYEVAAAADDSPWFAVETAIARIAVAWTSTSAYATDGLLDPALLQEIDALVVLEGLQA